MENGVWGRRECLGLGDNWNAVEVSSQLGATLVVKTADLAREGGWLENWDGNRTRS